MELHIKNMVCARCKTAVETELQKLGFNPLQVNLGLVEIEQSSLTKQETVAIGAALKALGFELLEDKSAQLVEQIKTVIIEFVHYGNEALKVNLSTYLGEKLGVDYQTLSATFSEKERNTIEQFFIAQKIERVKELLSYGEQNLSEIAFSLNYSSVAHLSAQFKKVTGQTPRDFKAAAISRKTLDDI